MSDAASSSNIVEGGHCSDHKKTRSREGCLQCRSKRRKCDIIHPRCGACCRVNSSCTYPPRRIDPVTGLSVTIKQPNKRKRRPEGEIYPHDFPPDNLLYTGTQSVNLPPRHATSGLSLDVDFPPHANQPTQTSSLPVEGALFPDIQDQNDFFSLFAAPIQQEGDSWNCPSFPMTTEASNNILLDLGAAFSGEHVGQNALISLYGSDNRSTFVPSMPIPDFPEQVQKRTPDPEVLDEMRQFWAELLQFYASLTENYYYSTSIADRQRIFQSLVSENLTDVHLAASAYLCAARRVLLFQLESNLDKTVEWNQRAQRYHQAAREMMTDASYPLCSRVGAGIDLRLGYILQDNVDEALAIHEMTRSIIQQSLGVQPVWYITDQLENSTISFTTFITTDVLYSLVGVRRQTIFDVRVPDLPLGHEPGLRIHLGIPAAILSALAQINNLTADPVVLETPRGIEIAAEIDEALKNWRPEIRSGMTASCLAETVAVQAMWCEVAKILLHQQLYNRGILSKPIRTSLSEFLRTSQSIPDFTQSTGDDSRLFVRASRACAWFIASTCAISSEERRDCLKGLNACGNERVFRENAKAIQAMWEEMDIKGRSPEDWRAFLDQIKATVVFL